MSSAVTLYEAEQQYQALLNSEELVTPEQEDEFIAELAAAVKTVVEKRDRVAGFIRDCVHREDAIDRDIAGLTKLKRSYTGARERLERSIAAVIEDMGTDDRGKYPSLRGETCVFSLRRKPPHVEIRDQDLVPEEFKSVTITMPAALWSDVRERIHPDILATEVTERWTVDKAAVKAAIEHGVEVEGADIGFGGVSLSLR